MEMFLPQESELVDGHQVDIKKVVTSVVGFQTVDLIQDQSVHD